MKSIRKDKIIEEESLENIQNEKKVLLGVDHPFLVGMKYIINTDDHVFFVMDFVRGGELWQLLDDKIKLPEDHAKFYVLNIAIAIGYLHSKNIIYRDLKSENVMIDESGFLKLTDFGLTKILSQNEMATSFCGTPNYMAPEIVQKQQDPSINYSFSVDWWSLGILTYEMLLGIFPFQNNN